MKKFIGFMCLFILFVYEEHIQEDWSSMNKFGKVILYPFWFIRSILIWIISPIFIFEFMFKRSFIYKKMHKIITTQFPDKCPKCGEIKGWIKMPHCRTISDAGERHNYLSMKCLKCKYETTTIEIYE